MPKIILLAALGLLIFLAQYWFKRLPAEEKKQQLSNILIWSAIGITLLLVVTGKLHWLSAAIAAVFGAGRIILPLALKALPFLAEIRRNQTPPQDAKKTAMALAEAYAILGLSEGASKQDAIDAHRRLIAKLHPDKGGNDFLAAQLNTAKDTILKA